MSAVRIGALALIAVLGVGCSSDRVAPSGSTPLSLPSSAAAPDVTDSPTTTQVPTEDTPLVHQAVTDYWTALRRCQQRPSSCKPAIGAWRLEDGEPTVRARELHAARPGLPLSVGNPHVVVALADDDELDAARPHLHPACSTPRRPTAPTSSSSCPPTRWSSTASDASACASTSAAAERRSPAARAPPRRLSPPATGRGRRPRTSWRVEVPGGAVGVTMFARDDGEHVTLSGPAELVFSGALACRRRTPGRSPSRGARHPAPGKLRRRPGVISGGVRARSGSPCWWRRGPRPPCRPGRPRSSAAASRSRGSSARRARRRSPASSRGSQRLEQPVQLVLADADRAGSTRWSRSGRPREHRRA